MPIRPQVNWEKALADGKATLILPQSPPPPRMHDSEGKKNEKATLQNAGFPSMKAACWRQFSNFSSGTLTVMGSKAWAGDTETTGLATHKTIFTHLANSLRMCSLRRYIKKDRKTLEPQTEPKQHYLVAAGRFPALLGRRARFPQVSSSELPPLRKGEGRERWGGLMVRRTARRRDCAKTCLLYRTGHVLTPERTLT